MCAAPRRIDTLAAPAINSWRPRPARPERRYAQAEGWHHRSRREGAHPGPLRPCDERQPREHHAAGGRHLV